MQARVQTILILVWLPIMAAGQDADRMAAMRTAYAEWTVLNDVTGTGALAFQGVPVTAMGNGSDPVELASVGKSITALCAAALSDAGRLDFSASVRAVLGRGPEVSVASLVTHTSGITRDLTQSLMGRWLDGKGHKAAQVLDLMTDPEGTPGLFSYNNVNYALLALVIEAVAKGPYEDTCRRLVIDPVGVRGLPSPRAGAFLSWGGWAMSPLDFARFHAHWFGPDSATGRAPLDYPHVALGDGGAYYGLGTVFRDSHTGNGRYNFWHFGALCFPGRFDVGAFAVTWGNGWTAFLAYDGCVDDAARSDLDFVMGRAAFGPFQ